jgi:hypothetical protein
LSSILFLCPHLFGVAKGSVAEVGIKPGGCSIGMNDLHRRLSWFGFCSGGFATGFIEIELQLDSRHELPGLLGFFTASCAAMG